jgi:hypothetical protein
MKRILVLAVLAASFAAGQNFVQAQELLLNGDLNLTDPPTAPEYFYDTPRNWILSTDPCSNASDGPCTITPYVGGNNYTPFGGYPAGFADRLGGGLGVIGEAYQGHYPFEIVGPLDVQIRQAVPGVVGKTYIMSGWAHFEAGYAGGVEFLNIDSPNQRNQDAQAINPGVPVAALTDTIFALEFLDSLGTVLPGSIVYELHEDGGQQNDNQLDGRDWVKHTLTAVAPAGTVSVQVRAAMIDGEFNFDPPGQSQNVFFDDFSLIAVPEPSSMLLSFMGLAFLGGYRRSR